MTEVTCPTCGLKARYFGPGQVQADEAADAQCHHGNVVACPDFQRAADELSAKPAS